MTLLEVNNLTLQYRDAPKPIIRNLSFSLEEGETLCLQGPSGAGKSTLVWALMGMMALHNLTGTGTITFHRDTIELARCPQGLCRDWKEISLVPQASMTALNPVMTVGKTLQEMLLVHEPELSPQSCRDKCRELMELVRLPESVLSAYPHTLSGGMRQRISIALGVMYHPQLLILDEATTGLDLLVEADILGTVRRLKEEYAMSILMITHDKRLAEAFCSRQLQIGGNHD